MDTSTLKHYTGDIKPEPNTIFVFGSNPEGRHGAGAAKVAREQFGPIWTTIAIAGLILLYVIFC